MPLDFTFQVWIQQKTFSKKLLTIMNDIINLEMNMMHLML